MRIVGARTRKAGIVDQLGKGWFVHGGKDESGMEEEEKEKEKRTTGAQ